MVDRTDILKALENIAPASLAEMWDNCGMQIDLGRTVFSKILVCLEITNAVIDEAVVNGVDLIVTHHPLYFRETKNIIKGTLPGDYTIKLIRNNISVYSAHTSFDKVQGGNNTELCDMLGLTGIEKMYDEEGSDSYIGYVGNTDGDDPLILEEFAVKVRNVLGLKEGDVRYTGDPMTFIYKVGVCTGAGADLAQLAKKHRCDVLVTGDMKYHDAQNAKEMGIAVIDAGHYGTEAIFAPNMADKLRLHIGRQADIIVSDVDINPVKVL